ncbi:MAG: two-component regulator propeller domain-containing protein [Bacteroidota bacterium]|nr:two-component regulator propeller domain-containing protein [Bacteroidota bacterium]
MKKLILITLFILSTSGLFAQVAVGNWRTHLAYTYVTQVEETPEKVYGVSDGALFSYDKTDYGIERYDKLSGLNDSKISLISYSKENKLLLIAYNNSNIDLLTDDGEVINIPDINIKSLATDKNIYDIKFVGSKAYLSCGYGVSIINLDKHEFSESYMLNKKAYSTSVFNGFIYVATVSGIWKGLLTKNLSDIKNWELHSAFNANQLTVFNNKIVALRYSDGLFDVTTDSPQKFYSGTALSGILSSKNILVAYGKNQITYFKDLNNQETKFFDNPFVYELSSLDPDKQFWIASNESGMNLVNKTENGYQTVSLGIKPKGPILNSAYTIKFLDKKYISVPGGAWDDGFGTKGTIMYFANEEWSHVNLDTVKMNYTGNYVRDFCDFAVDPLDTSHIFVTSYGDGVYEFKSNRLVKIHDHTNSAIQTHYKVVGLNGYDRVYGICFDKKGNLYVANWATSNSIKCLTKEGVWTSLAYGPISLASGIMQMTQASNGIIWAVTKAPVGIFAFDPKGTLNNQNDDQYKLISSVNYYDNSELKSITPGHVYCIAEDKKGAIWIGSDQGPIVFNSPSKVFNDDFTGSRIKVPRNDGTDLADYLLDGVTISCIAVDGGNRKWIGTASNGVYLVSENGLQTIHHFTANNSPLLSDKILSIAIHPTTGEVFIGTDNGLISYRSDATTASTKYSDVYAFPNPVKPEYEGLITITGLKYKSTVRITDINGNSVFEGISEGGQITWNGRNRSGERVATGVYLVYAETSSGIDGVVTKIMVVR